jgi:hypothetical protein
LLEPKLALYAGPQSATPSQIIHVTIEAFDARGRNIDGEMLTLVYTYEGQERSITAKAQHGLVSFEIPAQRRAGHMSFYARYEGHETNASLVMITAGPAIALKLAARLGTAKNTIEVTSPVLSDNFGNSVTDLSLVSLNWIDAKGLKASHKAQLSNGAVNHTLRCPTSFTGPLRLQAQLGNLQFKTPDIALLCPSSDGQDA